MLTGKEDADMWTGGVRVIVLDEEDRMLLVKQHHEDKDIWMVPGGGIEAGENAEEAAAREVLEETGLEIEVGPLVWHVEEVSERGQRFVNFFMGKAVGGKLGLGRDPEFDENHQVLREVRFASREEIQSIPRIYPEYLRKEFWDIREKVFDASYIYNPFRLR